MYGEAVASFRLCALCFSAARSAAPRIVAATDLSPVKSVLLAQVRGVPLTLRLTHIGSLVEAEGISRVDLDNVVNEHHRHDPPDVDVVRGVLGEQWSHHREMPRVFGAVLSSRATDHADHALDQLQLVQLGDESELAS